MKITCQNPLAALAAPVWLNICVFRFNAKLTEGTFLLVDRKPCSHYVAGTKRLAFRSLG
jgi:hypothetical protein